MELKLPPIVDEVFDKLTKAGFQAFLVGGSVRDLILARSTHDWDFTTNATPAQIQEVF